MTELQRQTVRAIRAVHPRWYRADGSGQRVTLASLYRHAGVLERRAHRGREGEANAAYEYRINERWCREFGLRYVPGDDPAAAHVAPPTQAERDELLIRAVAGQVGADLAAEGLGIPDELEIGERVLAILEDPARLTQTVIAGLTRQGDPPAEIVAAIRRITAGRL